MWWWRFRIAWRTTIGCIDDGLKRLDRVENRGGPGGGDLVYDYFSRSSREPGVHTQLWEHELGNTMLIFSFQTSMSDDGGWMTSGRSEDKSDHGSDGGRWHG